jgi:hypothetical protein
MKSFSVYTIVTYNHLVSGIFYFAKCDAGVYRAGAIMQSNTMYVWIVLICKESMVPIVVKNPALLLNGHSQFCRILQKKFTPVRLPLKPMEMIHFLPERHLATRRNPCVKMKLTFSVHFPYG